MYKGDVGNTITFEVKDDADQVVPLTNATKVMLVMLLGGKRIERQTTVTNAASGIIEYTTVTGDLESHGEIKMQAIVYFSDGDIFHSQIVTDTVGETL